MAVLEDAAVRLRPLTPDDAAASLAGEDDEQVRWFEFPRPSSLETVLSAIERWAESWRTGGPVRQWGVFDRVEGYLLGGVEVRDLGGGEVNLSYVVFPAWRRRGIATRAARLALAYAAAELGATSALVKVLDGNEASLGVVRVLGARPAGSVPSDAGGTFLQFRLELPLRTG